MEMLRPSYFDKFKCKCGECKNCCCRGWLVSISEDEYFKLIGLDCSKELRNRLDVAFHLAPDEVRDEYRYAQITPRFDGWCPLHDSDGLCMLQKECCETVLPSVCRLYPRSIRQNEGEEVLSNSCEGVVEMLISSVKPLDFEGIKHIDGKSDYCVSLRKKVILLMQDRTFCLSDRIKNVGELLIKVSNQKAEKAESVIDSFKPSAHESFCDIKKRLRVQLDLLEWVEFDSQTEHEPCEKAIKKLKGNLQKPSYKTINAIYEQQKAKLYNDFPQIEIYWEQILVNHLFFERFPFSDKRDGFFEEYKALCATYAYLNALSIGCVDDESNLSKFVSLVSSAFRFIDHTSFDYNVNLILKRVSCNSLKDIENLLNT